MCVYIYIYKGTCGVKVIIIENGEVTRVQNLDEAASVLYSTNPPAKDMHPFILPSPTGKYKSFAIF